MLSKLYVSGGRQKPRAQGRPEWQVWGGALIVEIDVMAGTSRPVVEYVTPPDACAADLDPSVVFKAGTLVDGCLHACTQTEVITYSIPDFQQVGYVSLPRFNDVHHVRPTADGTLLVANTGLDAVVEVTQDGDVLREWSTAGEDIWSRFDPATDYRKVLTTKPHHSHPNYVFQVGGEIWCTRFQQRDAICLTRPEWRIALDGAPNHQGAVVGDRVYFTTVDAQLIVADAVSRRKVRDIDLNALSTTKAPLGWCRGLAVLDDDHVAVGFSRLRPTKFQDNLRWLKSNLGGSGWGLAPARVAVFDLTRGEMVWEHILEPLGLNIVFSIHAVNTMDATP